jgi:putative membrane protein
MASTPPAAPAALDPPDRGDRLFYVANAVVSAAALSLIAFILTRDQRSLTGPDLGFLPTVNAVLNTLSAACLVLGYAAIRRGSMRVHRALMIGAFVLSTLFFVGYLVYHSVHGDTRFTGQGPIRAFYFVVLFTHILLSMAVVPMALSALYLAARRQFARHARLTRVLLPIWIYVSCTGVLVYLLLRVR